MPDDKKYDADTFPTNLYGDTSPAGKTADKYDAGKRRLRDILLEVMSRDEAIGHTGFLNEVRESQKDGIIGKADLARFEAKSRRVSAEKRIAASRANPKRVSTVDLGNVSRGPKAFPPIPIDPRTGLRERPPTATRAKVDPNKPTFDLSQSDDEAFNAALGVAQGIAAAAGPKRVAQYAGDVAGKGIGDLAAGATTNLRAYMEANPEVADSMAGNMAAPGSGGDVMPFRPPTRYTPEDKKAGAKRAANILLNIDPVTGQPKDLSAMEMLGRSFEGSMPANYGAYAGGELSGAASGALMGAKFPSANPLLKAGVVGATTILGGIFGGHGVAAADDFFKNLAFGPDLMNEVKAYDAKQRPKHPWAAVIGPLLGQGAFQRFTPGAAIKDVKTVSALKSVMAEAKAGSPEAQKAVQSLLQGASGSAIAVTIAGIMGEKDPKALMAAAASGTLFRGSTALGDAVNPANLIPHNAPPAPRPVPSGRIGLHTAPDNTFADAGKPPFSFLSSKPIGNGVAQPAGATASLNPGDYAHNGDVSAPYAVDTPGILDTAIPAKTRISPEESAGRKEFKAKRAAAALSTRVASLRKTMESALKSGDQDAYVKAHTEIQRITAKPKPSTAPVAKPIGKDTAYPANPADATPTPKPTGALLPPEGVGIMGANLNTRGKVGEQPAAAPSVEPPVATGPTNNGGKTPSINEFMSRTPKDPPTQAEVDAALKARDEFLSKTDTRDPLPAAEPVVHPKTETTPAAVETPEGRWEVKDKASLKTALMNAFGHDDNTASLHAELVHRFAEGWANHPAQKAKGAVASDFYANALNAVGKRSKEWIADRVREGNLKGNEKASYSRSQREIFALNAPDGSSAMHELAHVFFDGLTHDEQTAYASEGGMERGKGTQPRREVHEKFVRDFIAWMDSGEAQKAVADNPQAPVFARFRDYLRGLGQSVRDAMVKWNGRVGNKAVTHEGVPFKAETVQNLKRYFDYNEPTSNVPETPRTNDKPPTGPEPAPLVGGGQADAPTPAGVSVRAPEATQDTPAPATPIRGAPTDPTNGWKLHLDTAATDKISAYLKSKGFVDISSLGVFLPRGAKAFKVGGNSGQSGKDMTVYVGSRDDSEAVARDIHARFADDLRSPSSDSDVRRSDENIIGNVFGRYDIHRHDYDFHQYGSEGIPYTKSDMSEITFEKDSVRKDAVRIAAKARAHGELTARYGEHYTGTNKRPSPTEVITALPEPHAVVKSGQSGAPTRPTDELDTSVRVDEVLAAHGADGDAPVVGDVEGLMVGPKRGKRPVRTVRDLIEYAIDQGRRRQNRAHGDMPSEPEEDYRNYDLVGYDPKTGTAQVSPKFHKWSSQESPVFGHQPGGTGDINHTKVNWRYVKDASGEHTQKVPVYKVDMRTGESNAPDHFRHLGGSKGDVNHHIDDLGFSTTDTTTRDGINTLLQKNGIGARVISKHSEIARRLMSDEGYSDIPDMPNDVLFHEGEDPKAEDTKITVHNPNTGESHVVKAKVSPREAKLMADTADARQKASADYESAMRHRNALPNDAPLDVRKGATKKVAEAKSAYLAASRKEVLTSNGLIAASRRREGVEPQVVGPINVDKAMPPRMVGPLKVDPSLAPRKIAPSVVDPSKTPRGVPGTFIDKSLPKMPVPGTKTDPSLPKRGVAGTVTNPALAAKEVAPTKARERTAAEADEHVRVQEANRQANKEARERAGYTKTKQDGERDYETIQSLHPEGWSDMETDRVANEAKRARHALAWKIASVTYKTLRTPFDVGREAWASGDASAGRQTKMTDAIAPGNLLNPKAWRPGVYSRWGAFKAWAPNLRPQLMASPYKMGERGVIKDYGAASVAKTVGRMKADPDFKELEEAGFRIGSEDGQAATLGMDAHDQSKSYAKEVLRGTPLGEEGVFSRVYKLQIDLSKFYALKGDIETLRMKLNDGVINNKQYIEEVRGAVERRNVETGQSTIRPYIPFTTGHMHAPANAKAIESVTSSKYLKLAVAAGLKLGSEDPHVPGDGAAAPAATAERVAGAMNRDIRRFHRFVTEAKALAERERANSGDEGTPGDVRGRDIIGIAEMLNHADDKRISRVDGNGTMRDAMGIIFSAPSWTLSRLQVGPHNLWASNLPPETQKMYWKGWWSHKLWVFTALGAAAAGGAKVWTDLDNRKFLTFQIGNRHFSIDAQTIRESLLPVHMLFAYYDTMQKNRDASPADKTHAVIDAETTLATRYLRYKLHPVTGAVASLKTGKNAVGEDAYRHQPWFKDMTGQENDLPVNAELFRSMTPIALNNMIDGWNEGVEDAKKNGMADPMAAAAFMFSTLGPDFLGEASVNTYGDKNGGVRTRPTRKAAPTRAKRSTKPSEQPARMPGDWMEFLKGHPKSP